MYVKNFSSRAEIALGVLRAASSTFRAFKEHMWSLSSVSRPNEASEMTMEKEVSS